MEEVEQSNLLQQHDTNQQQQEQLVYFESDVANDPTFYVPQTPVNNLINPLAIKLEKFEQPSTPQSLLPHHLHNSNDVNLSSSSVSTPLLALVASMRAECSHTLAQLASGTFLK